MEKIVKNTFRDFELNNGEIVKLTLTFGRLALLKSVDNSLYNRYNKITNGKSDDILDVVTIVYVAYWCANYGNEQFYTEKEFTDLVPFDFHEIKRVYRDLTQPKKKRDLGNRS